MSDDENKDTTAANGEKEMEVDQKEDSKPNTSAVSDQSDSEDEQIESKKNAVDEKKPEEKEDKKDSPKKTEKTSNKTPKKPKKQESDDGGDSDEEDGDKVALLERPVVISGKRERKKVERIDVSSGATPKEKKLEVPEGKGTTLGEIANIEFKLGKTLADDLKPLHRFVYGRAGTANEIKKNLRKFCGFDFKKDSAEYTKKVALLNKMTMAQMKTLCDILDLERGGTKETIVTRLMDFFMKPTSSGKKLLADMKRKRSSSGKGKKSKTKRGKKDGKKDKKKTKKKPTSTDSDIVDSDSDDDESAGEDDGSDEDEKTKKKSKPAPKKKAPKKKDSDDEDSDEESEEEEEDNDEDSDDEPPKKKKAKIEPKKEAKKPEKKSSPKKKKDDESSGSESDDEPLVKAKSPKPPSDDELKDVIKKILDGANLELVTMKTVCKQVYAKYEQFDLTDRKDFIKSTVKEIIR